MAIPLIAGPSGMAAVMLMGSNEPGPPHRLEHRAADRLGRDRRDPVFGDGALQVPGPRVLTAVERLMGMLLVAISVQMFLDGLGRYLKVRPAP